MRYKSGKHETASKTYTQLCSDSESFSRALAALGEQGGHTAIIGAKMCIRDRILAYHGRKRPWQGSAYDAHFP